MNTPLRRLSQIFQRKPTAATAIAIASVSPIKDENVQNFVNDFMMKSRKTSFRSNHDTYAITVRRLLRAGHFSAIHDILDHHKKYPDIKDERFTARLISLYGKAKMSDHALQLFDEMPKLKCPRTVISFNALLAAHFSTKKYDKIIEIFHELPEKLPVKPDLISYMSAIKAYYKMGSIDSAAISMLEHMEKNNVAPNAITFTVLLKGFARKGRYSEVEKIWNLMEEKKVIPNLRCYNSRLYAMIKEKKLSEAMQVLDELKEKGLKPNTFTYNRLFEGFLAEGNMEEVKRWYAVMIESGCSPNFSTCMTLIPIACDKNDVDFAYELWKRSCDVDRKLPVEIVKRVIDELVQKSQVEKAKEIQGLHNSTRRVQLDHLGSLNKMNHIS